MKTINKLFDYFEEFMLFIIMAAMIVMNFLNVVFRYLLPQSPFSYTEELTLLLFVWATMIGIACGLKRGSHTGMSLITDRLPPTYHKIMIVIATGFMCLFAGIVIYSGCLLVKTNSSYGNILPSLNISANWKSAAYPIGGVLMLYRSLYSGVTAFTSSDAQWEKRKRDKEELADIRLQEKAQHTKRAKQKNHREVDQ